MTAAGDLPRPTPPTPYRVRILDRRVSEDWRRLLETRLEAAIRCWDHISATPSHPVGGRYTPLKGEQSHFVFQGQRLRQWQWEIDRSARVKVAVARDFVVVTRVSTGHPKENE